MKFRFTQVAAAALGFGLAAGPAHAVTAVQKTVNGFQALVVEWTDSAGLKRSVALKLEGAGNSGHGGYAIQMVYRHVADGATKTRILNPGATGDGFGYFVSHERYRLFSDGDSAPIATKIFGVDDSPLGRIHPVTMTQPATGAGKKIVRFDLNYPHYGTVAANGLDPDTGEDDPPLGTAKALFKKYDLPVTITWYFQDGRDYPRIRTSVSLASVTGPDRVSFDLRGPYGKMNVDSGGSSVRQVRWGDRFHFSSTRKPLTRNSTWTWNTANSGSRYVSLAVGGYEMGLVEPRRYTSSQTNDGYAEARGKTSSSYNGGNGCRPAEDQLLPCDWEWSYQSSQYELPYDDPNGQTTSEKMAWGSTPYYGTSIDSTYDGGVSVPFDGFPASKKLTYDVCVVLGPYQGSGLTRSVANAGGTYKCANTLTN